MEFLPILSLVLFIITIVLGFTLNINVGLLSIGMAFILGRIAGIADNTIIAGFNTSIFVQFVGLGFLYGIAATNGTLDLISKKIMKGTSKVSWLVPIALTVVAFIIASIGAGNNIALPMLLIALTIAPQIGVDPVFMCLMMILTTNMGNTSPLSMAGIAISNIVSGDSAAITRSVFAAATITTLVLGAILYIRAKAYKTVGTVEFQNLPAFNVAQWATLAAILISVLGYFLFQFNMGLIGCVMGLLLCIFKFADSRKVLAALPWPTYLMVCGVSVLMKIIVSVGGIDLLTSLLTSVINRYTAAPLLALLAGSMSWFSSALGVVIPTLLPVAESIAASVEGASYPTMVCAICVAAYMAAFSPFSTSGGLIMSSYATVLQVDEAGSAATAKRLFLTSVLSVFLSAVLAGVGLYSIF